MWLERSYFRSQVKLLDQGSNCDDNPYNKIKDMLSLCIALLNGYLGIRLPRITYMRTSCRSEEGNTFTGLNIQGTYRRGVRSLIK